MNDISNGDVVVEESRLSEEAEPLVVERALSRAIAVGCFTIT
jgi:hypothetical protein